MKRPGFVTNTNMSRALFFAASGALVLLAAVWTIERKPAQVDVLFEPVVPNIESAPLCPWREPDRDMRAFFPSATHYTNETRILSGIRVELTKLLGRMPEADENSLNLHAIFSGNQEIGCVITRRVKGEHGAIELAVGINPQEEISGFRVQRMREPEEIASVLRGEHWQTRFLGRKYDRGWQDDDAMILPEAARFSGRAISEGMHSLLILRAAAERLARKGGSNSISTNVAAGV